MNDLDQLDSLLGSSTPTRRRFIVNTIGAGFALAVLPAKAQVPIKTAADGLLAGAVAIPTGAAQLPAYRAQPATGNGFPVVLVVSEIFGVHEYIQDVCRRLAHLGYCAIAPELFARQGNPRQMMSVAEIIEKISSKTPDAEVMADLDATVAWAAQQGANTQRLAITGFCWGGRITWLYAAHQPAVKAGVAWYGKLTGPETPFNPRHPLQLVDRLKAPVLGLYGGLDTGIPLESVEAMEQALQDKGSVAAKESRIHLYDNAPHAFHADYRPSYHKQEAEDGWQRMLAWFHQQGV